MFFQHRKQSFPMKIVDWLSQVVLLCVILAHLVFQYRHKLVQDRVFNKEVVRSDAELSKVEEGCVGDFKSRIVQVCCFIDYAW